MKNVITYQNSGNTRIDLTPAQARKLEAACVWPRNQHGSMTSIYHGIHCGYPSLTDEQVDALIAGEDVTAADCGTIVAR